tara:strand:- start:258 stop:686 length:429 start_codon:yes stop_codon:yes gene_type:complete
MKKKDLLKKLQEKNSRNPQPIKLKLDFDKNEDGEPDSYEKNKDYSNKEQSNETPDFYSQNFNDEGTNVRPLHKSKNYSKNSKTGDDHLEIGNNFTNSSKKSVGHDSWSGDDHVFEIIDEISSRILVEGAVKQNKKYLLKKEI